MKNKLPPTLRADLNRLAHSIAQVHEITMKRELYIEAMALFREGVPSADILGHVQTMYFRTPGEEMRPVRAGVSALARGAE